MEKKRMVGIRLIALINFLMGLSILMLCANAIKNIFFIPNFFWAVAGIATIALPTLIGVGAIALSLAIMKLKKGSRRINRIYAIIYILSLFIIHPHIDNFETILHCLRVGLFFIFIWMIVYLSLPKVKEQFK